MSPAAASSRLAAARAVRSWEVCTDAQQRCAMYTAHTTTAMNALQCFIMIFKSNEDKIRKKVTKHQSGQVSEALDG